MNEAINKSSAVSKQSRTSPHATLARDTKAEAPALRRSEIKTIPFTGLLTNKLLASLPGEEFARLLPYLEPVALSFGDYIYTPEDKVDYCYLLESAVVSQIHLLADGATTEVALIGNEGMVGLSTVFGAPPPSHWSETLIAGSALRIRAEVLKEEFGRGDVLQRLLFSYMSERLAHISQRAVCNGRHTLAERLCSWLLMINDRVENGRLMLTHEEMARHLGARRAGVSVVATQLRERRIISYNRGKVSILNREMLEASACECYRALARKPKIAGNGSNK